MKPTRERAIAALNAALARCSEEEHGDPTSDYERGRVAAMRTISQVIKQELIR